MKINIFKTNGEGVEVLLLPNKIGETYSFVNLTKGHICPCKFNSVCEALLDILSYDDNKCFELDGVIYSKGEGVSIKSGKERL